MGSAMGVFPGLSHAPNNWGGAPASPRFFVTPTYAHTVLTVTKLCMVMKLDDSGMVDNAFLYGQKLLTQMLTRNIYDSP